MSRSASCRVGETPGDVGQQSPRGSSFRARAALGLLLVLLAAAIYWASVVRLDVIAGGIAAPGPEPDAAEYFAMMSSIHGGKGPVIWIAGEALPSRYPHGYSALAAPLMSLLPPERSILAPFIANKCWGAATLVVVFMFFAMRGDALRGGIAALLVASLPAFMAFSRGSMSEAAGAFLVVASFLAMSLAFSGRASAYFIAAALLGLSLSIRISLVYFIPLLAAPLACSALGPWRRRVALVALGGATAGICASPVALANYVNFGSPLKTGYEFWLVGAGASDVFGLKYVLPNVRAIVAECTLSPRGYTVANIFGTGTHFVPAFVVMTSLFMWPSRWTAFHAVVASTISIAVVASLCYFYVDLRLFYPFMLLACVANAGGIARALVDWRGVQRAAWGTLAVVVLVTSVVGYPSMSGYPAASGRSQLLDGIAWASRRAPSRDYEAALLARRTVGDGRALVLSDTNAAFLSALLGSRVSCAPIDERHSFQHSAHWRYGAASAAALVRRSVAEATPVYALAAAGRDPAMTMSRLPEIPGMRWVLASRSDPGAPVLWYLAGEDADAGVAPAWP